MFSTKPSHILALCLVAIVSAVPVHKTKVKTVSIHSPKSGAHLNPIGALVNTKINKQLFSPFGGGYGSPFGALNPYAGVHHIGYGGGIGHGVYPQAIGGFGGKLGGYGGPYGGVGYSGIPGSYTVQRGYPVFGGHTKAAPYPVAQGYPGFASFGVQGHPYGIGQFGYSYGGAVNKLGGYGK